MTEAKATAADINGTGELGSRDQKHRFLKKRETGDQVGMWVLAVTVENESGEEKSGRGEKMEER